MVANSSPLLQPFRLGDLTLPNRVVMAPLTRNRATHGSDVPSELAATYYRQRASAGSDRFRRNADQPAGPGLRLDARHVYGRAGRRLAQGDRRRA